MTDAECREAIRRRAHAAGLDVLFLLPGQLEDTNAIQAVFLVEDFDSELETLVAETATLDLIQQAVERARQVLGDRSGCEIVHQGRGLFRCVRHQADCDAGEERDPVNRQALRWTAHCPQGAVTQTFYLASA
ncbi:MAG: hypothetical protein ACRD2E_04545 [Terriglobales bacterium]